MTCSDCKNARNSALRAIEGQHRAEQQMNGLLNKIEKLEATIAQSEAAQQQSAKRRADLLNTAVCPGCCRGYTRAELAAILWEHRCFVCPECDFEYRGKAWRPATLAELLSFEFRANDTDDPTLDVSLEWYTASVLALFCEALGIQSEVLK